MIHHTSRGLRALQVPLLCGMLVLPALAEDSESNSAILAKAKRSVVKIYVTKQSEDWGTPWQSGSLSQGTGSGFIIEGRRILTNGHNVSDARFIQVQINGDPNRYNAEVAFMGHDCDLAILTVADKAFFENTRPLSFAEALPELNDEVVVMGYPMGGQRLSITKGVVSRIDYSVYSFSAVDSHLVLQVDAAINPGNSGGPVFFNGKVIGVAFQGITRAQNIGYTIPLSVVQRFLQDIDTGVYDGFPELGIHFLQIFNPALHRDLRVPARQDGIVVTLIDPFGSAHGILEVRDVLLAIDGHNINKDGNIELDGKMINFQEIIERKQRSDTVTFDVWRQGKKEKIEVPLSSPYDPFIFRNVIDERPRYAVVGGLVFSPLNREFLSALRDNTHPRSIQLHYYARHAKSDGLYKGVEEFVILIRRLPHPVNTYTDGFINGIVARINGKPITRLQDVRDAAATPENGFHVIEFADMENKLILDARAALLAEPQILGAYGVPAPYYLGDQ